ncbi:MAG: hypothetical protein LBU91_07460 [Bacteroidales bacterium]|jgi:hypothetical protein|nr:hypothetical protein [Bacteroidales bacterium]
MKKFRFIIGLVVLTLPVFGQQNSSNQTTSLCGGRWEFFMSEIAARVSLKIDKFTGDVYQLVKQKDETDAWVLVIKESSRFDIKKQDCINYQLFSSGLGVRHTFLLNTNSGFTWRLVEDRKGNYVFQVIEE